MIHPSKMNFSSFGWRTDFYDRVGRELIVEERELDGYVEEAKYTIRWLEDRSKSIGEEIRKHFLDYSGSYENYYRVYPMSVDDIDADIEWYSVGNNPWDRRNIFRVSLDTINKPGETASITKAVFRIAHEPFHSRLSNLEKQLAAIGARIDEHRI